MRQIITVLVVSSLVAACGGDVHVLKSCPLVTGSFKAHSRLESSVGTCPLAKPISVDSINFDEKGGYISPLEGVVDCRTVQEDCSVHVQCDTTVIRARGTFDGLLSLDGLNLFGSAKMTGNYQGCSSVTYTVSADRLDATSSAMSAE